MADDLQLTMAGMDWAGVGVAVLVATFLGFLWYTPLFGKRWAREMKMDLTARPTARQMAFSMTLFVLSNLLMAYVLWHEIHGWLPSLWAEHLGAEAAENSALWTYGLWAALFNWLGFMVPLQLSRVAWENGSWTLVAINAGFDLVRLVVMGLVLAFMSGQA